MIFAERFHRPFDLNQTNKSIRFKQHRIMHYIHTYKSATLFPCSFNKPTYTTDCVPAERQQTTTSTGTKLDYQSKILLYTLSARPVAGYTYITVRVTPKMNYSFSIGTMYGKVYYFRVRNKYRKNKNLIPIHVL